MKTLIKLNHLSAWLLLIIMLIYFATGLDMLKTLWQPDISRYLHNDLLPIPTLILILFHTGVGVKLSLIRNKLDNKFFNFILVSTGLIILVLFTYLLYR